MELYAPLAPPVGNILVPSVTVDFNAANTDTQIPITLPAGFTRYVVQSCRVSGASASISTATAGMFTAAAGAGTAVITAASTITIVSAAADTNNNAMGFTINTTATLAYSIATVPKLFFRVANAQGSAATGTVTVFIVPLP